MEDKALEMGQTSATGSFHLFVGKSVSTIVLAVGTIILGLFILQSDYGLYAIALIPAGTFMLFQDWGVGAALTKYCANYKTTTENLDGRKIIIAGLTFEIATAIILTLISLLTARFVASSLFNKPEAASLIGLCSVTILSSSLLRTSQSIFVGFERMRPYTYTMIIQAITQSVLAPLLVIFGFGAFGALVGYTISTIISGILGITLVYFAIFRKMGSSTKSQGLIQTLKPLLSFGLPLGIASILTGSLGQIYSFMIASFYNVATIGDYRIATNFAVLLGFVTIPISTVLFPAFSKLNPQKDISLLRTIFKSSVKYTAILLVPIILAMVVLSNSFIETIYGGKWPLAPYFLALLAVTYLVVVFGYWSINGFFSGIGETRLLSGLILLTFLVGLPLGFVLAWWFGLPGIIISTAVSELPSLFVGLYLAKKRFGAILDYKSSAKIILASVIAAFFTNMFLTIVSLPSFFGLLIGASIFLVIYLVVSPIIGAIDQTDINNLRAMFSSLGTISKILEIPLKIIEKSLRLRNSLSK